MPNPNAAPWRDRSLAKRAQTAEDYRKVSEWRLHGVTSAAEIASNTGLKLSTVRTYLRHLDRELKRRAGENIEAARGHSLAVIDRIVGIALTAAKADPRSGAKYAEVVVRAEERRAKLLGLDKQSERGDTTVNVQQVTIDERRVESKLDEFHDLFASLPTNRIISGTGRLLPEAAGTDDTQEPVDTREPSARLNTAASEISAPP